MSALPPSPVRGPDRRHRAQRGTRGTFAGHFPPKSPRRKAIFDAIKKEYSDSREWAKAQNILWKESINDVPTVQLCWKMMKEIMDPLALEFEQKREVAKETWRSFVQLNF